MGYESLRETETLRSLSSTSTAIGSYVKVILENMGIMVLLVAAVYGGTWLVLELTHISLTASDIYWLIYHALAGFILAAFFFFAGTSIQLMTRFTLLGAFAAICLWGTLVFLAPVIVDYIVKKEAASMPSGSKIEYNKLTIITEFEKKAVKESGKRSSNSPKGRKEVVEGYWNTDFPKVQKEE
ncbi:MAG: hypothetical protein GY940_02790, partial [bacterium]|nr:hypothetical protein [bacterium]